MSISTALNISSQGMDAQATRLSVVANNVANGGTPGYQRQAASLTSVNSGTSGGVQASVRNVDSGTGMHEAVTDMTEMIESAESFALNADVFEAGADMWQALSTIKRD